MDTSGVIAFVSDGVTLTYVTAKPTCLLMVGQYDYWQYFVPARLRFNAGKINRVLKPTDYLKSTFAKKEHVSTFKTPHFAVNIFKCTTFKTLNPNGNL
jgi:hypothetical protein